MNGYKELKGSEDASTTLRSFVLSLMSQFLIRIKLCKVDSNLAASFSVAIPQQMRN